MTEINGVRDAYLQFMGLRPPVKYWTTKSATHKTAARTASIQLAAYFAIVMLVLGAAFFIAGDFLLDHLPKAGEPTPTALYVVVSGGLAVLSTVAFWIGDC